MRVHMVATAQLPELGRKERWDDLDARGDSMAAQYVMMVEHKIIEAGKLLSPIKAEELTVGGVVERCPVVVSLSHFTRFPSPGVGNYMSTYFLGLST